MSKDHLCIVCSDWHFGKAGDGYDIDVAKMRVANIVPQLGAKISIQPDTVHVLSGGDMVEGEDIYPGQAWESEGPVIEQVQVAATAFENMLMDIRRQWPDAKIHVHAVRGNHGRMSKSAHPSSNWDVQLIYDVAQRVRADPRIRVARKSKLTDTFKIGPAKVLLTHKGPKHASTPAMQAKILRATRHYGVSIFVCGHWHHAHHEPIDDVHYISNGSLCGADEFAKSLFFFDPPKQMWFTVDGKGFRNVGMLEW